MNKETKKKVKLLVRAFLCANKGKTFTTKQICDFINENNFGMRDGIMASELSRIMNSQFCWKYGISRERKRSNTIWHYGVMLDG